MIWDGRERRRNADDHDTLTRIESMIGSFLAAFEEHKKDDGIAFEKHDSRLSRLEHVMWGVGGAVVVVQVFLKFFHP